jgi:hypothetical protein
MAGQWMKRAVLLLASSVVCHSDEGQAATKPEGELTYAMHLTLAHSRTCDCRGNDLTQLVCTG